MKLIDWLFCLPLVFTEVSEDVLAARLSSQEEVVPQKQQVVEAALPAEPQGTVQ